MIGFVCRKTGAAAVTAHDRSLPNDGYGQLACASAQRCVVLIGRLVKQDE